MSGTVWTKFYWSDWESDPALRLCSLAAQGLWMRMLCIASAHDPIGYVAVAGRGLEETSLARMTGCSESEVRDLLGELDRNGVFSRDRTGRIYSRRMIADAKRSAISRKNGKKGGNPSLGNNKGKPAWDNPTDKSGLKTQEPEARSQIYSEPIGSGAEAAPPSPVAPDHDKLAWSEAVRIITAAGVSERSARSFFGKLLSANGLIARDLLPSLTAASVNATGDPQSYLTKAAAAVAKRRGCMEGPAAPNPSAWGDDEWRAAVEIWGESGAWSDALGPPPDQPGTRVPPDLRPRPMKAE